MAQTIPYKSFCWSLGTTSFRTRNFNKTIEEQLALLDGFWLLPENRGESWQGNSRLQARYYDYMRDRGFVVGNARNKPKDAREKTSGLVDIGLIGEDRRLTGAGRSLLDMCLSNDFAPDNFFGIPRDSYLYLRQLLKTSCPAGGGRVRPFLVLLYVLSQVGYLTLEEFTYLLPLCTGPAETERVAEGIRALREGRGTIDGIVLSRLMSLDNYRAALGLFLSREAVDEGLLCEIGLNRKSRRYDRCYYPLYCHLHAACVEGDPEALLRAYQATRDIKIGALWRGYLFDTSSEAAIARDPESHWRAALLGRGMEEEGFRAGFFQVMHLLKAKATLSDYLDLNRRYVKTTDVVLFEDGRVRLDIVPRHFFGGAMASLYRQAYSDTPLLPRDCPLEELDGSLVFREQDVIQGVNRELGVQVGDLAQARQALEDDRYARLQRLIDARFTDGQLLALLDHFRSRDDAAIRAMVTDNADVPTIFEYVLGILWYKVSRRQGKLLDYMKLSLDGDLLPKTHAGGGEADIVYEYPETACYPRHALLLEATLADRANQRRMEMEPVSRHLGQHLLRTGNLHSYCVFATNDLNINVIADFRSRKNTPFYDSQDYSRFVEGMKIIPLEIPELKRILAEGKTYEELYPLFEAAFRSTLPPHRWYQECFGG